MHGYHHEEDEASGTSQPFFYDTMFSTLFITLAFPGFVYRYLVPRRG